MWKILLYSNMKMNYDNSVYFHMLDKNSQINASDAVIERKSLSSTEKEMLNYVNTKIDSSDKISQETSSILSNLGLVSNINRQELLEIAKTTAAEIKQELESFTIAINEKKIQLQEIEKQRIEGKHAEQKSQTVKSKLFKSVTGSSKSTEATKLEENSIKTENEIQELTKKYKSRMFVFENINLLSEAVIKEKELIAIEFIKNNTDSFIKEHEININLLKAEILSIAKTQNIKENDVNTVKDLMNTSIEEFKKQEKNLKHATSKDIQSKNKRLDVSEAKNSLIDSKNNIDELLKKIEKEQNILKTLNNLKAEKNIDWKKVATYGSILTASAAVGYALYKGYEGFAAEKSNNDIIKMGSFPILGGVQAAETETNLNVDVPEVIQTDMNELDLKFPINRIDPCANNPLTSRQDGFMIDFVRSSSSTPDVMLITHQIAAYDSTREELKHVQNVVMFYVDENTQKVFYTSQAKLTPDVISQIFNNFLNSGDHLIAKCVPSKFVYSDNLREATNNPNDLKNGEKYFIKYEGNTVSVTERTFSVMDIKFTEKTINQSSVTPVKLQIEHASVPMNDIRDVEINGGVKCIKSPMGHLAYTVKGADGHMENFFYNATTDVLYSQREGSGSAYATREPFKDKLIGGGLSETIATGVEIKIDDRGIMVFDGKKATSVIEFYTNCLYETTTASQDNRKTTVGMEIFYILPIAYLSCALACYIVKTKLKHRKNARNRLKEEAMAPAAEIAQREASEEDRVQLERERERRFREVTEAQIIPAAERTSRMGRTEELEIPEAGIARRAEQENYYNNLPTPRSQQTAIKRHEKEEDRGLS